MAYRRGTRKPQQKKRFTKKVFRVRYTKKKPGMYRMSTAPTPESKIVKLKYSAEPRSIDGGVGTLGIHVFSANGCYDPDITSGGHQPMGFDQWMLFYEHYEVLGSKITVTFWNSGEAIATNQYVVGIYTDSDTSSTTSLTQMLEQPGTRYSNLGILSKDHVNVTKYWSAKKFFGNRYITSGGAIQGNATTNPAEQAFWHVFAGASDNLTNPGIIYFNTMITFIVKFTERKTLAQS